jgi:co-chaperonin GroES (HSP10)
MNFKPLNDRVLISVVEAPKKESIILVNDTAPTIYVKVEAIGDKVTKVSIGDIVIVYKSDPTLVEVDNVSYGHLREEQIVGIYTKEIKNA